MTTPSEDLFSDALDEFVGLSCDHANNDYPSNKEDMEAIDRAEGKVWDAYYSSRATPAKFTESELVDIMVQRWLKTPQAHEYIYNSMYNIVAELIAAGAITVKK